MSELNIFIPKETQITLFGAIKKVKPLTIKRTVELTRLLEKAHKSVKEELSGAENDMHALLKIISACDGATCAAIIEALSGIELNGEEAGGVENMQLEELSHLVKAVSEVNDFGKVFENFTLAFRTLAGRKGLSETPSQK